MGGVGIALMLLIAGPGGEGATTITLRATVRPLAEVLKERGIEMEVERLADQLVILIEGGEGLSLLPNSASRAFFTDARLRDREAELVGRRIAGLPHFETVLFRVKDEDGVYRIAEYYCDVCAIATRYDQICPCCQGALRLRYQPSD